MSEVKVKLQPFRVPNYVLTAPKVGRRQDGMQELPKFHLSELDEETLNELCDEFRAGVLKKAAQEVNECLIETI